MSSTPEPRDVDIDHVSERLTKGEVKELKLLYHHYFKKCKMQEWSRVGYNRTKILLDYGSILVAAAGVIGGGVTANIPVITAVAVAGLVVNRAAKALDLDRKVEQHSIAYNHYKDLVIKLKSYIRGAKFNEEDLISYMSTTDKLVGESTPITKEKYRVRYDKTYQKYNGDSTESEGENIKVESKKKAKLKPLNFEEERNTRRSILNRVNSAVRRKARGSADFTSDELGKLGGVHRQAPRRGVRRTSSAPTIASVMSEIIKD